MATNGLSMTPSLTGASTVPTYVRIFVRNDGHLSGYAFDVASLSALLTLGLAP
jgi:hypothetical protein